MKPYYFLEVQIGYERSIIGLVASYKVGHLGKPIYHHQNGIFVALGAWETKYEVHTHI